MKVESLFLVFIILFAACEAPSASGENPNNEHSNNETTAADLVRNIKVGWNLGNSLDAADLTWLPVNPTVTQMGTG